MSDFLSRLAERALGATPPLQPLVGSRFAAPAEPAGFVEETVESDASAPTLRRSALDTPAPPPPPAPRPTADAPVSAGEAPSPTLVPTSSAVESRRSSPAETHTPAPEESRTAAPQVSHTTAADEPRTPSPDRTAPDARAVASSARPFEHDDAAPTVREVAPSARAPEPSPPPARASSRVPAERVETSRPAQLRVETDPRDELLIPASTPPDPPAFSPTAAARDDGNAPQTSAEARPRVAGESMEATEPAPQPGEPADEPRDREALLMPVARRSEPQAVDGDSPDGPRTDARQPWAERQPEKERPVVQVTIGRIEVRAVHPPAAPQPARAPGWTPPVLTLDEYLKRGSGR